MRISGTFKKISSKEVNSTQYVVAGDSETYEKFTLVFQAGVAVPEEIVLESVPCRLAHGKFMPMVYPMAGKGVK